MTTDKLVIPATRLAAVLADANLFASTADKYRPILRAVKVTASGGRCQAVSTDSYGLGIFTCDAEGTLSALIDTDDVKRIVTLCKDAVKGRPAIADAVEVVLERDDETLTVRSQSTTITARLVPGEFPNWSQLVTVPQVTTGQVSLNPAFVERMARVRLGESTKSAPTLTMQATNELKPWHFYASANGIEFRGLLMPVRNVALPAEPFGVIEEVTL